MGGGRGGTAWLVALLFAAGCGTADFRKAVLADRTPAAHHADLSAHYAVRCPDVLEVRISGPQPLHVERAVGPDGHLDLSGAPLPRLEGLTVPEVARAVAAALHVRPEQVEVRVARHESQQLFLHGEVEGLQRVVPYVGPETVLDLLQRVGGLGDGAAPSDVTVVRPHVADGKAPEVFRVDLPAIVLKHEQETNVRLEPFDQVYIGESRRSFLSNSLPPWLRPVFNRVSGLRRDPAPAGPPPDAAVAPFTRGEGSAPARAP
jgi:polysaccharide biosynthesis/export protein